VVLSLGFNLRLRRYIKVAKAPSETPDMVTPASVGAAGTVPDEEEEPAEDVIEIDEWLLTFAGLFRTHLGDAAAPEGPLDLRAIGLEKCCEAGALLNTSIDRR
jgi:hypothetical protein